jgi:hypothetical protein
LRIIFDQCTPRQLRKFLVPAHEVKRCAEMGWDEVENGELISTAEAAGFDLMISCDQNVKYQQNLSIRKISLVVLGSNHRPTVLRFVAEILKAVNEVKTGSYEFIEMPHERTSHFKWSPMK